MAVASRIPPKPPWTATVSFDLSSHLSCLSVNNLLSLIVSIMSVVSFFRSLEWNTIGSFVAVSDRRMQEKSRTSRPLGRRLWNMGVYPGITALISRADTTLLPENSISVVLTAIPGDDLTTTSNEDF